MKPCVRMSMRAGEGTEVADELLACRGEPREQELLDQLWLRGVFIEQTKRMPRVERPMFEQECDAILSRFEAPLTHRDGVREVARAMAIKAVEDRLDHVLTMVPERASLVEQQRFVGLECAEVACVALLGPASEDRVLQGFPADYPWQGR